jgi:hypothetical protein
MTGVILQGEHPGVDGCDREYAEGNDADLGG